MVFTAILQQNQPPSPRLDAQTTLPSLTAAHFFIAPHKKTSPTKPQHGLHLAAVARGRAPEKRQRGTAWKWGLGVPPIDERGGFGRFREEIDATRGFPERQQMSLSSSRLKTRSGASHTKTKHFHHLPCKGIEPPLTNLFLLTQNISLSPPQNGGSSVFGGGLFTRDDSLSRNGGHRNVNANGGLAHPTPHSSSSGNIAGLYGQNDPAGGSRGGETDRLTQAFGAIGVNDHPSRSATAPLLPFENPRMGFAGHRAGSLGGGGGADRRDALSAQNGPVANAPSVGHGGMHNNLNGHGGYGNNGHDGMGGASYAQQGGNDQMGGAYAQQQAQMQQMQQLQQMQQMQQMGQGMGQGYDGSMGMPGTQQAALAAAMAANGGGMGSFGSMGDMAQMQMGGAPNAGMGAAQHPPEMAEVYQAAYAAAFYAQQQQLQQLLRLQAQAQQRGGHGVGGLDQAALAAAAAGLLGPSPLGPARLGGGYGGGGAVFGGASNGGPGGYNKGASYGGGYGQVGGGGGGRDDRGGARGGKGPRGGRGGAGMNGHGRGGGGGGHGGGFHDSSSQNSGGGGQNMHGNGHHTRTHSSGNLHLQSDTGSALPNAHGADLAAEEAEMDARFGSVSECLGQIATLARDQHGCRFLQRKFDEDGLDAVTICFDEILEEVVDLMMDPFGNYLVQKLLECCSDDQRVAVLTAVAKSDADDTDADGESTEKDGTETSETQPKHTNHSTSVKSIPHLVSVALNTHGTRAVQKLVETLKTPEQVLLLTAALRPGVVTLIKDLNGNHVIQRCLQRLRAGENQFVYDAARMNCVEIATHRHGCCVLQRCVDHADDAQRVALVEAIAEASLVLSQDPFGNYVVQYVLDLGFPWCNASVMRRLQGTYAELSTQKFSSNVVEKCLKRAAGRPELELNRNAVVVEIMHSPLLDRLLMDPYGNYVVQSSLCVTHGTLRNELVERIKPHLPLIKNSPFGKRILRLLLEHGKK